MIFVLKKWIVGLLICVPLQLGTAGALDLDAPVQTVTSKDKTLILHEGGKKHSYDFDDEELQFTEIDTAKLLFQNRVNQELYLLLYVVGPSTGGGNGSCGAGQEEYLVWLALGVNWKKDNQKLQLIASCFENIGAVSSESYLIKGGKLTSEYLEFKDDDQNVKNTLIYDSRKPEKAWSIERKPWSMPGAH